MALIRHVIEAGVTTWSNAAATSSKFTSSMRHRRSSFRSVCVYSDSLQHTAGESCSRVPSC